MSASNGVLRPGLRDLVTGGAVDFLVTWISRPDPVGLAALAEWLPMMLVKAGPTGKVSLDEPLVTRTKQLHDGTSLTTAGDRVAWAWQHDTLTLLARNTHGRATEVVALLDDRKGSLGHQHKPAWQDWLRLSNLLNLRLQEAHVTTWLLADEAQAAPRVDVARPDVEVQLAGPWGQLVAEALGPERRVLELLADLGVSLPTLGHETPEGVPLSVSWPHFKVVVDVELDDEDRNELAGLGWVVVAPEAVPDALDRAGDH